MHYLPVKLKIIFLELGRREK